jgi:hypothetical protein
VNQTRAVRRAARLDRNWASPEELEEASSLSLAGAFGDEEEIFCLRRRVVTLSSVD